jgi:ribosomal protein S18 acetylase RimI-like enzyme
MNASVSIREFRFPADYEHALQLWQSMESGVTVGRSDSAEEIERKLQRDPDLFLVAELNGAIIGTVIGGYDGRRGMIYHLAVQAEQRKRGVATQLLDEVEKRLQARGCVKCYLLIFADNTHAAEFYTHRGWREMSENRVFGKEFS